MSVKFKVIHYINQFFAGIGGEEKARIGPEARSGPVGPGRALQEAIRDWGDIVATILCGDDYFTEKMEEATQEMIRLIVPYQPDLIIAGPAFNAGRYGIASGEICKSAQVRLKIPAVTGMYEENPGVELYKKDIYIVKTSDSVRGMNEAIFTMAEVARKLLARQEIGRPDKEGYFPQGYLKTETSEKTAAERAVDMLLSKMKGLPFVSELPLPPKFDRISPSPPARNLSTSTIALVTDGGLVPKGNPDKIQSSKATKFGSYSIHDLSTLHAQEYEINHIGYDTVLVKENPNILVPVDVMREFEKEGIIGRLNETFYSTTGVGTTLESCKKIGQGIAKRLQADGVTAVILTSTWGTSTRCGAVIAKEIEEYGIPTAHVCTMTPVALMVGSNRVITACGIAHPLGNPDLDPDSEKMLRKSVLERALQALQEEIKEQKLFTSSM